MPSFDWNDNRLRTVAMSVETMLQQLERLPFRDSMIDERIEDCNDILTDLEDLGISPMGNGKVTDGANPA